MTPQLHRLSGKNGFCGPTAMASVLGISTDHAARIIRSISGDKRVTGVHDSHLWKALMDAGCKPEYHRFAGTRTPLLPASEWVQVHRALFETKHVIIVFGHHYGTLLGGQYQCSLTRRLVPLEEMPQAHEKVESCIVIHELPEAAPRDEAAIERKRNAQALGKAQTLARKFGIVIEKVLGCDDYIVYSPELLDDDPHDHLPNPSSGQEVLAMVEDYVHCLQSGYLEAVTAPCLYYPPQFHNACSTFSPSSACC